MSWRLKTYLATRHGIFKATELRKKIIAETNIAISLQNLCNLLNGKPQALRLRTIEILCTALACELSDFCQVRAGKVKSEGLRKLSFQNTPYKVRAKSQFPDPTDYDSR